MLIESELSTILTAENCRADAIKHISNIIAVEQEHLGILNAIELNDTDTVDQKFVALMSGIPLQYLFDYVAQFDILLYKKLCAKEYNIYKTDACLSHVATKVSNRLVLDIVKFHHQKTT